MLTRNAKFRPGDAPLPRGMHIPGPETRRPKFLYRMLDWVGIYLKFRAHLYDWYHRPKPVPKRNGIVQKYTDLEKRIAMRKHYGGQRAMFLGDLGRMEDELTKLKGEKAIRMEEEMARNSIRRRDAVEATRKKNAGN